MKKLLFLILIFSTLLVVTKKSHACSIFSVTPNSGETNTIFRISAGGCISSNWYYLKIRPSLTQQYIFDRWIQIGSGLDYFVYDLSNFISPNLVSQIGFPNQITFELYDRYPSLAGYYQGNKLAESSITFNSNQIFPVACNATVNGQTSSLCPSNCPAGVLFPPNSNNWINCRNDDRYCLCTDLVLPRTCTISNFTVLNQNDTFYFTAIVDGRNLRSNEQYKVVLFRNPGGVLPNADNWEFGDNGTFNGGEIFTPNQMHIDPDFDYGDRAYLAVVLNSDFPPSGIASQICRSEELNLTLDNVPRISPGVSPVPSDILDQIDDVENSNPNSSNPAFQILPCNGENGTGIETAIGCLPTEPGKIVNLLISIAIGLAGGIAFLLILYGALKMIISRADPKALQESKEVITSAIVGLLLIILSVVLLNIIGVNILCIPGFGNCGSRNESSNNSSACYQTGTHNVPDTIDPQVSCCKGGRVISQNTQNNLNIISCN